MKKENEMFGKGVLGFLASQAQAITQYLRFLNDIATTKKYGTKINDRIAQMEK